MEAELSTETYDVLVHIDCLLIVEDEYHILLYQCLATSGRRGSICKRLLDFIKPY